MPAPGGKTTRTTALAAVAVAATLFGTAGVARGLGPDGLTSTFVASWRAVIGGLGLVVFAALRGSPPWRGPWTRPAIVWSVVGGAAVIGYQAGFFAAADRVGVGAAAVVTIGTGPVVAGLLDRYVGGVPMSPRWAAGVAVAVAGIVALSSGAGASNDALGWAAAVAAGCCYPVYGLAAQRLMSDRTTIGAIATVFGAGALLTTPLAIGLILGDGAVGAPVAGTLGLVLYVGLVATSLAYGLWAIGLAHLSLSDTVTVTLAEPVAAVLLSAALLDEPLGAGRVATMAVVLAGVAVATTGGEATQQATTADSRRDLAR